MSTRAIGRGLGWARIVFGAGMFLAPRLSARLGGGPSRDLAGVALGVRGMGARDLAVGLGTVRASSDREIAAWLTGAALIDLSDVLTLLLALRRMPLLRNLLFITLALGGAAAELYVAADLRKGPGPGEGSTPVEG